MKLNRTTHLLIVGAMIAFNVSALAGSADSPPPSLEYGAPKIPAVHEPSAQAGGADASAAGATAATGSAPEEAPHAFTVNQPLPLLEAYDDDQELAQQSDVKEQRRLPLQGIQQMESTVNMVVVTAEKKVVDDRAVQVIGSLVLNKIAAAGFPIKMQATPDKTYPHLTVYALGETTSTRPTMEFAVVLTDIVRLARQPERAYETVIWKRSVKRPYTNSLNAQGRIRQINRRIGAGSDCC